ncbi:MAG TPA: alpha/beta fold hydrolase, partial [Acidimicrobiales bacterium]|nr:alpha/beta fold hydrolase [Acidimicrobiales bacterium]
MIAGNDGTRIATECRGDGPSLVFTHGWANNRSVWTPIADDLAGDHSVTTWDLRGHGESDSPPPGNYSRQHALGDMNAVVDDTDRPAVLIGHSLGGYLSLAYALEHPDEVSALVLVASGPGFRKVEARDEWNEAVV